MGVAAGTRLRGEAQLAKPVRRLFAWILDAAVLGIVFTPLNPGIYSSDPSPTLFFVLWGSAMPLIFAYLVAFDGGERGATPGKRVVGIRVADAQDSGPIGYRRATIRRGGYLLGGLLLFLGWLWLILDPRRQAWHDKLARSIVIRSR